MVDVDESAATPAPAVIVVTRLAVRRKHEVEAPSEEWIRRRVEVLRQISLPSLALVPGGLEWILLVDESRAALVRSLIGDMALDHGSLRVGCAVGFAPTTSEITLDAEVHPGATCFVTARLDSDDALLPSAVAAVARVANDADDGTLIDLPHGYQLDLRSGSMSETFSQTHRQGPFLALVHRSRDTMLDTGGEHPGARRGRPYRRVTEPSWIQTIHGGNVSNRFGTRGTSQRVRRAVGGLRAGDGRAALVDGRVLPSSESERVLAAAGITSVPRV